MQIINSLVDLVNFVFTLAIDGSSGDDNMSPEDMQANIAAWRDNDGIIIDGFKADYIAKLYNETKRILKYGKKVTNND